MTKAAAKTGMGPTVLVAVKHLGYDELAERYVKPTGRQIASSPVERMVYAEKL